MGTNYYTIIPKLKLIICLGRHVHEEEIDEDLEKFNKFINLWDEYSEGNIQNIYEIEDKILRKITLNDIMTILFYITKIKDFMSIQNSPNQISIYKIAKYLDKDSYIISEYSEKMSELNKERYKIMDEDERS